MSIVIKKKVSKSHCRSSCITLSSWGEVVLKTQWRNDDLKDKWGKSSDGPEEKDSKEV